LSKTNYTPTLSKEKNEVLMVAKKIVVSNRINIFLLLLFKNKHFLSINLHVLESMHKKRGCLEIKTEAAFCCYLNMLRFKKGLAIFYVLNGLSKKTWERRP
jgi:hypothetical protein